MGIIVMPLSSSGVEQTSEVFPSAKHLWQCDSNLIGGRVIPDVMVGAIINTEADIVKGAIDFSIDCSALTKPTLSGAPLFDPGLKASLLFFVHGGTIGNGVDMGDTGDSNYITCKNAPGLSAGGILYGFTNTYSLTDSPLRAVAINAGNTQGRTIEYDGVTYNDNPMEALPAGIATNGGVKFSDDVTGQTIQIGNGLNGQVLIGFMVFENGLPPANFIKSALTWMRDESVKNGNKSLYPGFKDLL